MQNVDQSHLVGLIRSVNLLRSEMLELEASDLTSPAEVPADRRASARNLIHYLALRRHDVRPLQSKLAGLGLSSLGRTEPHVLSSVDAVLNVRHKLAGSGENAPALDRAQDLREGASLLEKNAEAPAWRRSCRRPAVEAWC